MPNELVDDRTTAAPRSPVRRFELSEGVLTWSPGVPLARQAPRVTGAAAMAASAAAGWRRGELGRPTPAFRAYGSCSAASRSNPAKDISSSPATTSSMIRSISAYGGWKLAATSSGRSRPNSMVYG